MKSKWEICDWDYHIALIDQAKRIENFVATKNALNLFLPQNYQFLINFDVVCMQRNVLAKAKSIREKKVTFK